MHTYIINQSQPHIQLAHPDLINLVASRIQIIITQYYYCQQQKFRDFRLESYIDPSEHNLNFYIIPLFRGKAAYFAALAALPVGQEITAK